MAEPYLELEHPADDGKVAHEIGRLLREIRLARGKEDLARVAQYLWVPLEHLEALEQGDLSQAAGRFDPAVLVRRYADHLGLDGHRLAERLGTASPQAEAAALPQHRTFAYTPGVRLVAVAGAALLLTAAPVSDNRTVPQPLLSAMGPLEPSLPPHDLGRSAAPEPTVSLVAQDMLMRDGSLGGASHSLPASFAAGAALPAERGEGMRVLGAHRLPVQPSSGALASRTGLLLVAAPAQEGAGELYREATELYRAGKYAQALPLFERALELAEARYGSNSPRLALDLNNLGEIHRLLGQHEAAEPLFQRAIDLAGRPGTDGRGLGSSLNNLALLYREQGRLAEATRLQERAVAAFEAELGPDHPRVSKSVNNLAALYQEQTLAIVERVLAPGDLTTEASRGASSVAEARSSGEADADAPFPTPKPPSPEGLAPVDLPPGSRAGPSVESPAGAARPVAQSGEALAIGRPVPPPLAPLIEPVFGALIGIGTANVLATAELGGTMEPAEASRRSDAKETHPESSKGDPEADASSLAILPAEQHQAVAVPEPRPAAVATSQGNHTGQADASQAAGEETEPPAPIRSDEAATPSSLAERAPRLGRFSVLVSSMRDPADVVDEWRLLQQNYPVLANLELWPPRPEATESEVVYRLVAGSLASVAEAEAICETLRWDGQHCSVVPFPGGREDRGRAEGLASRAAPAGGFTIQVALVRDPAEVPLEWRRLTKRHPDLAELELRPPRAVEAAEKGIFHRVTGGSFATRAEAQAACERLREEGGECLVVAP